MSKHHVYDFKTRCNFHKNCDFDGQIFFHWKMCFLMFARFCLELDAFIVKNGISTTCYSGVANDHRTRRHGRPFYGQSKFCILKNFENIALWHWYVAFCWWIYLNICLFFVFGISNEEHLKEISKFPKITDIFRINETSYKTS